jgi:hypothetical protein
VEAVIIFFLDRGGFWLRVGSKRGLDVRWDRPPLLYSERSGHRRAVRLLGGRVRIAELWE